MKKILNPKSIGIWKTAISVFFILVLTGCQEQASPTPKETPPTTETSTPTETKTPTTPTSNSSKEEDKSVVDKALANADKNIEAIKTAISNDKDMSDEQKAIEIARLFATENFTMKDRINKEHVGGLEYVHPSIREKMRTQLVQGFHYSWYDAMIKEFGGKDKLPEVIDTKVESVQPETLQVYGETVPAYKMTVLVRYGENYMEYNMVHVTVGKHQNVVQILAYAFPETHKGEEGYRVWW
ncbi:hypothetical protein ACFYKX_10330 [Cytobacillus sp. FJAT-54145]|uniref:Lipoprotein n=1 Tax=Cytobacillus spartinae TaxID=3299023 RepID=A0ABW6KDN7_9BACI